MKNISNGKLFQYDKMLKTEFLGGNFLFNGKSSGIMLICINKVDIELKEKKDSEHALVILFTLNRI